MLPLLTPIVSASGWVGWSVHVCTLSSAPPVLPHTAVIDPSSRTPSKNFCSLMDNVEIAPPYCGVYIRLYWIFSPIFEAKYLFVLIYYWSENFLLDMCAVFIEIDVFFWMIAIFFFTCSFVVCWWQYVLYSMLLCTLSPPVLCSVQSFLFQDLLSVELSGDNFIYIIALSL